MSKHHTDIIFGFHAIESALHNDPANILQIFLEKGRHDKRARQIQDLATQSGIAFELIRKNELDKLAAGQRHQGMAARYRVSQKKQSVSLDQLLEKPDVFFLILDGVTDPHNLGACLRSADAAGVDAVIVPKDRAAGITPVVRKVACGAADTVTFIQVTNLARTMEKLKQHNVWITGAAGEAEQFIYDVDLNNKIALVLGAEEKGMRRLTREHCDQLVRLPMLGQVTSLNVSVATGVCLYEVVRQRHRHD